MLRLSKQQYKFLSLGCGLVVSLLLYFLDPFHVGETPSVVLAVAGLMITWWVMEALPMPVVALLPIILFPLLGISTIEKAAAPYANSIIFLFMGGFMLGLAIEKWDLHKRIALNIIRITGTSGDRIVLGFIIATGVLSMWLSNTATTMMMLPIALSVIRVMKENHIGEGNIGNFSLAVMLAIAYASNIGGIATIVGTPPNVAYVGYLAKKYNYEFAFADWMMICAPLSLLLLGALYLVLVKLLFRNRIRSDQSTRELIRREINLLGPVSVPEKRVLVIFLVTALLWITRELINKMQSAFRLDDTIIAMLCAVALFICPAGTKEKKQVALLEWGDTAKMAWGILLLFGGGLSLAAALESAGLMQQLGGWLSQFSHNVLLLIIAVTIVSMFISEVMSNIAQVIVFAPVVSSLADAMGINPLLLGLPMTLAASCAAMMPMGTPPNAIVFSSGYIRFREMAKAGFVMNLVAIVLIVLFCWLFLPKGGMFLR